MDGVRVDSKEPPEGAAFEPLDVLDVSGDGVRRGGADEVLDLARRPGRPEDAAVFEGLVVDCVSGGSPALLLACAGTVVAGCQPGALRRPPDACRGGHLYLMSRIKTNKMMRAFSTSSQNQLAFSFHTLLLLSPPNDFAHVRSQGVHFCDV